MYRVCRFRIIVAVTGVIWSRHVRSNFLCQDPDEDACTDIPNAR